MNDDILKITLHIHGTEFKLNINRSEESYYRRAEREINKVYASYCTKYSSVKDINKLSAMTLLHFAVHLLYEREHYNDVNNDLLVLNKLIEDSLK
jgi:cell division protein ZapA